jgi:type II secretory pathway pseudopilin PulG
MLVGLIVAIFLILLALSVAAPKVAHELRREREVEAVHRGNQYVRAIRLYYRKFGHYPGSIEQLEKTNNTRFLRQRYVDPMTGKDDWRLIKVGEAKTTVKGFFGQPLAGLTPGLGSAAGNASAGPAGAGAAGQTGSPNAFGGSSPGTSAFGGSSPGAGAFGGSSPGAGGLGSSGAGGTSGMPTLGGGSSTSGATGGPTGSGTGTPGSSDSSASGTGSTSSLGSAAGIASQSQGSSMSGGAPFVGVGVPKEGDSITVLNEQTAYNTWEFIYDPRIEQLYAKAALFGGASSGTPGLGSAAGNSSGFGGTPTGPGSGSSGFGTTPSSGFGSGSGSGFGSSPGTAAPTPPSAPPQPPQQ